MDQTKAPLYEAICDYARRDPVRLHVPGHKSQPTWSGEPGFRADWPLAVDVTELPGTDDLHHPTEAIAEAQRLAAECFGAEETHFLVGGSTVGNLAMIMAVCGPGDVMLVPRNVHKSVLHGLMLAGAKAVFIPPKWEEGSGLAAGVEVAAVEAALERHPLAAAVMVTSPGYYGHTSDIAAIAALAHRCGKPLLVDEAHGAHFGFHDRLPRSAMQAGADASVQSSHKMLSALTMGAMLHLQGGLIPRARLKYMLSMLQSSSPSYPILASLDLCRREIALHGDALIGRGLERIDRLSRGIAALRRIESVRIGPGESGDGNQSIDVGSAGTDPFKLILRTRNRTWDGFALRRALERYQCYPELADSENVLLALSIHTTDRDVERLIEILRTLDHEIPEGEKELPTPISNKDILTLWAERSEPVTIEMPFDKKVAAAEAADRDRSGPIATVPLHRAIGCRSAEMVIPYPPGIPIVYAGERISGKAAALLERLSLAGAAFHGASDATLSTIRVYCDGAEA